MSAFNLLVIGHGVVVVFRVDVRGLGDILASVYYTVFRVLIFGLGEKELVEYSRLWPWLMRRKSWLYGHVILGGLLALLELIAYLSKWVTADFVGAINWVDLGPRVFFWLVQLLFSLPDYHDHCNSNAQTEEKENHTNNNTSH